MQKECYNCGETLKGEFCHACGQKVRKERLSVKYLLTDFFSNVFNAERGAIPTTLLLLKSPEVVVKDFIRGKTQSYVNPFKYVFFLATLSAIAASFIDFEALKPSQMFNTPSNPESEEMGKNIIDILRQYFTAIQLLIVPLYAWVSYRVYKKEGYNYAEHVAMVCYLSGFMTLISTIGMLPFTISVDLMPYYNTFNLLFNIYFVFAYYRIGSKKGLLGILKAVWFVVLFYLLLVLFFASLGFIWVLVK
ncbi:DUF3667 domain-containing protein [Cytophagales bacterium LB-30]|uniref:DUF3667 domain-containing protein n=2 Tax=Shiella aurantiaca TaxID=3058365 RepID=A0ABT8F8V4_9BACT|nr:DUF3667 domain-containing protein [Shiella aurantiaca]